MENLVGITQSNIVIKKRVSRDQGGIETATLVKDIGVMCMMCEQAMNQNPWKGSKWFPSVSHRRFGVFRVRSIYFDKPCCCRFSRTRRARKATQSHTTTYCENSENHKLCRNAYRCVKPCQRHRASLRLNRTAGSGLS
jgi:hypothetical protein